jgi:hypothetical protein
MSFDDLLLGNYKAVSANLGLTIDGGVSLGQLRIYGIVDGVPVQLWFGPHSTHATAPLTMPANFEFDITTRSLFGKIAGLFHEGHDRTGDEHFDKTIAVKSSDMARLTTALDPVVKKALLEMADLGLHPAANAHTVHLRRFSSGGSDSVESIERHIRETSRLARVLGGAFAQSR